VRVSRMCRQDLPSGIPPRVALPPTGRPRTKKEGPSEVFFIHPRARPPSSVSPILGMVGGDPSRHFRVICLGLKRSEERAEGCGPKASEEGSGGTGRPVGHPNLAGMRKIL
jgi:hypothetical protein